MSDPEAPVLAGRVYLGGVLRRGGAVTAADGSEPPEVPDVSHHRLEGGPQMLQLSLDGRRLYVTNSLLSTWDAQLYPAMAARGSYLLKLDVGADGALALDARFYCNFGAEPGGPVLAHECRYPGGDCTSDIWL